MAKKEEKEIKNKNVHEVSIKIEGDTWTEALDKVFKQKQKNAKVDGFRKGKVPREIYEKKFGKESLFIDAADMLLQEAYIKALDESKLVQVAQPAFDLISIYEDGFEFKFKISKKIGRYFNSKIDFLRNKQIFIIILFILKTLLYDTINCVKKINK